MFWKAFTKAEELLIVEAVRNAELETSGEIRVHVDRYCKSDPLLKAKNLFHHLKMDATALHNGVIIYVAIDDRRFAIYGDSGIAAKVEPDFWDTTAMAMREHFKTGQMVSGIIAGLKETGLRLKEHFPREDSDINEQTDEISYG